FWNRRRRNSAAPAGLYPRTPGWRDHRPCQCAAKARSNGRRRPLPGDDRRSRTAGRSGQEHDEAKHMKLPRDIGPIHLVGIGGIGMSGIAEVLANLGYTVTGSDVAEGGNVKRLRDKGVKVTVGHAAANIEGADVVVVSSAIRRDNPELVAARAQRRPVVRR